MKKDSQSYSKTFTLCSSLKYDNVGILIKCFFESAILINECQSAIIFNSNVTWFLRGASKRRKLTMQEIAVEFVHSRQQKRKTVYLKDDNGKF